MEAGILIAADLAEISKCVAFVMLRTVFSDQTGTKNQ